MDDLEYFLDPDHLRRIWEEFAETRRRVEAAVAAAPKSVTLEDALKQIEEFNED